MSPPLIVGKIWDSEYPWDVRVEKVCAAITGAGHRVELVCRNRDNRPLVETDGGLRIHRMSFRPHWPIAAERLSSFPAFVNPRWYRHALNVFRSTGVDVIVCRDLPLAPLALVIGRRLKRPVIVDVAEHYPGLLKDLFNRHDFRVANLVVRNPVLASIVERETLPRADGVWVVVDEMAERLVAMGIPPDRIALVSNTPEIDRLAAAPQSRSPGIDGTIRLVYLGIVERSRGLGVVLDAVAKLGHGGALRVTLDVFGDGSGLSLLQARAKAEGIGDRVTFHGRRPYQEILSALPSFDAGVIPHHATDHWNFTIQNKLFDYLSAGLPVVVSSMPPAMRIVTATGAGVSFRDRDPNDLIVALGRLAKAADRAEMGRRGIEAIIREFNWQYDQARLLRSLEAVAARGRDRSKTTRERQISS